VHDLMQLILIIGIQNKIGIILYTRYCHYNRDIANIMTCYNRGRREKPYTADLLEILIESHIILSYSILL